MVNKGIGIGPSISIGEISHVKLEVISLSFVQVHHRNVVYDANGI